MCTYNLNGAFCDFSLLILPALNNYGGTNTNKCTDDVFFRDAQRDKRRSKRSNHKRVRMHFEFFVFPLAPDRGFSVGQKRTNKGETGDNNKGNEIEKSR